MHKGRGKAQQIRGHKRRKKVLIRSANKLAHKNFILSLMNKYGADFDINKLKPLRVAGQVYLSAILYGETNQIRRENINNEFNNNSKIVNNTKKQKSQVDVVKPQIRRSKSGSA